MIRSTVIIFLFFCISLVRGQDDIYNVCPEPTILELEGYSDDATFELDSNGDVYVYPGDDSVRAAFVNQRQGALKFYTEVNFGENDALCEGLISTNADTLTAVVDLDGYLAYYDLVYDVVLFDDTKRSVLPNFYTLSQVDKVAEENVFSLSGNGNYFFSGNTVINCIDEECSLQQLVTVKGEILSAMEGTDSLFVLSVLGGDLLLFQIKEYEVVSVDIVNLNGMALSQWSFLTTKLFVGLISVGDNINLVTVSIDGTTQIIESSVGPSTIKVMNRKEFNFVGVQTSQAYTHYVCKDDKCKKVSTSAMLSNIWDVAMNEVGKTVIAFAEVDDITIVSCEKFDCRVLRTTNFKAPGEISNLKVSFDKNPTIVFSLVNGATAIAHCIDVDCKSISLSRASDYLSSPNFAYLQTYQFSLYANEKIQTFNTPLASPSDELCRSTIAGNRVVENGEVFICNALPVVENYSPVYYWSPVVTSVFAQNL